jgi:hypothetical protein
MATIINADTATGGAIITGDGSGVLALQAAGVTKLTVAAAGVTIPTLIGANVNLTSNVTGTLPVANGGTGATTLTGVIKGTGTSAITAATAGTDYVAPGTATTFTAPQTFSGTASNLAMVISDAAEVTTVSATAATGIINYDVTTQSVLYYTTNASGNFTVNVRGSSGTTFNTLTAVGQSVTIAFLVTQGATAYYASAFTVDSVAVTPKWQGGTAPAAGNASSIDVYSYTIVKTAATPTYTVFASQTKFA